MSADRAFGGAKSESQQKLSIIPRLPAVIPSIDTAAGSFLRVTPNISDSPTPIARIRGRGPDEPITNIGALKGLGIEIGLAPEIAAIREEVLGGRRDLIGDVQGDIETLRGIQNPFIQARVAPFVEEQERARRSAIRRGVAGPLTSLATKPFTRQIADQQALATFDAQAAIRQGQEQIRALLSDVSGEGRALLEQELRLLGLSQQQIRDIIASQLPRQVVSAAESKSSQQTGVAGQLGSLAGGIGGVVDFFSPAPAPTGGRLV